jgi:metal-responsive CopG/Arc/MetJ family transcriptional regulator
MTYYPYQTAIISLYLTEAMVHRLDELVDLKRFKSRSDACREIIHEFLANEKKNDYIMNNALFSFPKTVGGSRP